MQATYHTQCSYHTLLWCRRVLLATYVTWLALASHVAECFGIKPSAVLRSQHHTAHTSSAISYKLKPLGWSRP